MTIVTRSYCGGRPAQRPLAISHNEKLRYHGERFGPMWRRVTKNTHGRRIKCSPESSKAPWPRGSSEQADDTTQWIRACASRYSAD